MECGDRRSGQYVFYDLKLSKEPCNIAIPTEYTPTKSSCEVKVAEAEKGTQAAQKESGKKKSKNRAGLSSIIGTLLSM